MYNFIDVNEVSEVLLPSEALQINGDYIEDLIEGYRTLHVSGREALSPELNTFETGVRDGAGVKGKRYPARTIVVTYQLVTDTPEAFRDAYNKLGAILDVEDAELIFNDESDKYFIGTPSDIGGVEAGTNSVIGEFEIFCADPFKYSVEEYLVEPDEKTGAFIIDYNGTYKSYPKLEASFYEEDEIVGESKKNLLDAGEADCGYVAFFNDAEKIIQLGDPDEDDIEKYPKAQTLINQKFNETGKWNAAARDLWAVNSGVSSFGNLKQVGTLGIGARAWEYHDMDTDGTFLTTKTISGAPLVNYKVTYKTFDRTESTVKVEVKITTSLEKKTSVIGTGREIIGHIQINGDWYELTIKKASSKWSGTEKHTVTKTIKLINIDSDVKELDGIKFKATRTDDLGEAGELDEKTCANLKISTYKAPTATNWYLKCTDYDGEKDEWCGAAMTRTLKSSAENFTITFGLKLCIGDTEDAQKQRGSFQCNLTNSSGKILAGVRVSKSSSGKKGNFIFYVNGKMVKNVEKDLSYRNKYFGHGDDSVKTCTITKSGNKVTFNMGGAKTTFTTSATSAEVTDVTFIFAKYSTYSALKHNGLLSVKFVKNNCDTYEDIPNKFNSNDVVVADCKTGEIYLNDTLEESLGALGNDWEQFYLRRGLNQIGFAYSDWVKDEYAPTFRIRYREVFL